MNRYVPARDATRPEDPAADWRPLAVNGWSTNGVWIICLVMALFGLLELWSAVEGHPEAAGTGVAYLLFALLCGRIAIAGVVLKGDGIKLRTLWRTLDLRWDEIEDFELRGTIFRPSLRVKLIDGRVVGAHGLAARTEAERQRAKQILEDLRRRLADHATLRANQAG